MFINTTALILAGLTGTFRLAEIAYGEIQAKRMRQNGSIEYAPWQRWPIFMGYGLWLALLPLFTLPYIKPHLFWVGLYCVMEMLRWWAIKHLGLYWTTRIMIVPGGKRITTGPYRFLPHPIYIALFGEVVALSLAFHQTALAECFGGLTALWIYFRVKEENAALSKLK